MCSRRIVVAVERQKSAVIVKFAFINYILDLTIITSDLTFGIRMQSVGI